MNIIVAPSSPIPSRAANSIQVMKMSEAFANLGHKVTLITKLSKQQTPAMKDPYAYYGVLSNFRIVKLYSFAGKRGAMLNALVISMLGYLLQVKVIYTRSLIIAYVAVKLGHAAIYERHDPPDDFSEQQKKLFQKLVVHKNFNVLVVTSNNLRKILCQEFAIPVEKIIVASNGAAPIVNTNEKPPFERKEGRPVVGHIGHLYKGRGTDLIIALAKALPAMDFHIIGGMPKDIEFWKEQAIGLPNLYFYDYIDPARVPAFMLNCDILIAPYNKDRIETASGGSNIVQSISPLKIFNYMSSGKPIICSDLPVIHEIIENNKTALFCPSGDVSAWKAAIQRLCDDPLFAQKLGQEAKEEFLAHYTWEKRAEAVLKNLKTLPIK